MNNKIILMFLIVILLTCCSVNHKKNTAQNDNNNSQLKFSSILGYGSYYYGKEFRFEVQPNDGIARLKVIYTKNYKGDVVCPLNQNDLYIVPPYPGPRLEGSSEDYLFCPSCFYFYVPHENEWRYESSSPKSFAIPLTEFSKNYLNLIEQGTTPFFMNKIDNKTKNKKYESFHFFVNCDYNSLRNNVISKIDGLRYSSDKKIFKDDLKGTKRNSFIGVWQDYSFNIAIVYLPTYKKSYISVILERNL